MAVIPLTTPYSLKRALLYIAADDYTAAVSQVQFDPTTQPSTWRGIGGNVVRDQSIAEWAATMGLAQDLAPDGLLRYLLDHEGEQVAAMFFPVGSEAGNPAVEASLILSPATIGGTADGNTVTASVTLAVVGKPAFNDAPTPPAALMASLPVTLDDDIE